MKSYELVIARQFFCVGALLEMIFRSDGYYEEDQVSIIQRLGVNVPEHYAGTVAGIRNVTIVSDVFKWGVIPEDEKLNRLFRELGLPYEEEFLSIRRIPEWSFQDELVLASQTNDHLIIGFDYGVLTGNQDLYSIGHVCLVAGVAPDGAYVSLVDPGPRDPGTKNCQLSDLYTAIRAKNDGLWKIRKIAKSHTSTLDGNTEWRL